MVTQKCLVLLDHESGMLFIVSWCFGGLFGINTVAKLTVLVVLKEGWSLFYRVFQRHVYYIYIISYEKILLGNSICKIFDKSNAIIFKHNLNE